MTFLKSSRKLNENEKSKRTTVPKDLEKGLNFAIFLKDIALLLEINVSIKLLSLYLVQHF